MTKLADANLALSIIALSVNGLNNSMKKQRQVRLKEHTQTQGPNVFCL